MGRKIGILEIIKKSFMEGYMGKEKWGKVNAIDMEYKDYEYKLSLLKERKKDKNSYPDFYMKKSCNSGYIKELIKEKHNFILTLTMSLTGVDELKEIFENYEQTQYLILKDYEKEFNKEFSDNYFLELGSVNDMEGKAIVLPALVVYVEGVIVEIISLADYKKRFVGNN